MTIYVDVLFMVNLIINILIVEGCGAIICKETKWYRTLLAALVGAVYSVVVFFPNLRFVQSIVMKIAVSGAMVFCAFKSERGTEFLKIWGSFYLVSFIFGGSMVAVMSLTGLGAKMGAVYSNGTIYFNLPWKLLFASGAGTYFLIALFSRIRKKRIAKEAIGRNLSIYINGKRIDTKAIIDTGNSLMDPITGDPVIVCEYGEVKRAIPKRGEESLLDTMCSLGMRVRIIPFTSVGKKDGLMPAFLPDMVKIDELEAKRCIIGISETRLSPGEDYHALLNPAVIVK